MNSPDDIIRRMLIIMQVEDHPFFVQRKAGYKEMFNFMYGIDIEAEIINTLEKIWEDQEEYW